MRDWDKGDHHCSHILISVCVCMDSLVRQWENELWNRCWINQGVLDTVLFADNHAIIATTRWPSSGSMCLIQHIMNTNWSIFCKTKITAIKENDYFGANIVNDERVTEQMNELNYFGCSVLYIYIIRTYIIHPKILSLYLELFYLDLKQVIKFRYGNYMDNGGTNSPMHVWQLYFTKTVWNRDINSRDEIDEVICRIYP